MVIAFVIAEAQRIYGVLHHSSVKDEELRQKVNDALNHKNESIQEMIDMKTFLELTKHSSYLCIVHGYVLDYT